MTRDLLNVELGLRVSRIWLYDYTLSVFQTITLNVVNGATIVFLIRFVFGVNKYLSVELRDLKISLMLC